LIKFHILNLVKAIVKAYILEIINYHERYLITKMYSLRKLSVFLNCTLRNNVRRTLTSQPAANANVDKDKGMYSKYHEKYVQADVRFANTYFILEKTILVKQMGKVTTIGINRPEKRNCLDVATAHLLSEAARIGQ